MLINYLQVSTASPQLYVYVCVCVCVCVCCCCPQLDLKIWNISFPVVHRHSLSVKFQALFTFKHRSSIVRNVEREHCRRPHSRVLTVSVTFI